MIEDDAYETQSTRSIGIVENPLYAEPEEIMEMPTYSTLSAKEMEADVCLDFMLNTCIYVPCFLCVKKET